MPVHIKDDATGRLVDKLANLRDVSKQDAIRIAETAELGRIAEAVPLRERFARLRAAHPSPPPTGVAADKAFFDSLWSTPGPPQPAAGPRKASPDDRSAGD